MLLLFWRGGAAVSTTVVFSAASRTAIAATRGATGSAAVRVEGRAVTVPTTARSGAIAVRAAARRATVGTSATAGLAALLAHPRAVVPGQRGALGVAVLVGDARAVLLVQALHFQIAGPIADLADGGWTNELGSAVDLYASIDEVLPSDADYIQSSLSPLVVDEVRLLLAPLDDPGTSGDHILRLRYQKNEPDGHQIDLVVRLYASDGTTIVREETFVDIDAVTDAEITLSPAEAGSVTTADYAALILVFRALKV